MRGVIRLEQSGVEAIGDKMRQIGADQEHHRDREETFQKRKEKFSENIISESGKIRA